MYRSKYSHLRPLWTELEALEIYETWLVADDRFKVPKKVMSVLMSRGGRAGKFRAMKAADGILFVRIK